MNNQQVIIFDGPDGCGKTNMAKELSERLKIPYFKMTTEHENWRKGKFKEALQFDQTYISKFLLQTGHSVIIDRAYPAEWAYSKVFNRDTCEQTLISVDADFASMNAVIIVPLKTDYSNNVVDELVDAEYLPKLHSVYEDFITWTKCTTISIYVDKFDNNLDKEIISLEHWYSFIIKNQKLLKSKNIILHAPNYMSFGKKGQ